MAAAARSIDSAPTLHCRGAGGGDGGGAGGGGGAPSSAQDWFLQTRVDEKETRGSQTGIPPVNEAERTEAEAWRVSAPPAGESNASTWRATTEGSPSVSVVFNPTSLSPVTIRMPSPAPSSCSSRSGAPSLAFETASRASPTVNVTSVGAQRTSSAALAVTLRSHSEPTHTSRGTTQRSPPHDMPWYASTTHAVHHAVHPSSSTSSGTQTRQQKRRWRRRRCWSRGGSARPDGQHAAHAPSSGGRSASSSSHASGGRRRRSRSRTACWMRRSARSSRVVVVPETTRSTCGGESGSRRSRARCRRASRRPRRRRGAESGATQLQMALRERRGPRRRPTELRETRARPRELRLTAGVTAA